MSNGLAQAGSIGSLTGEQRRAAATRVINVFIEAGPGTGKTTVSAQRFGVQRFAPENRHDHRAVVAVSFTRAATRNLRRRVQRLWGLSALTWPHRIVTLDTVMNDLVHSLLRAGLIRWPNQTTLWPDGQVALEVHDSWAAFGGTHGRELLCQPQQTRLRSPSTSGRPASPTAAELGASPAALYLIDYDQVLLVPPLIAEPTWAVGGDNGLDADLDAGMDGVGGAAPLVVSGTLAGRAYGDLLQLTRTAGRGLTVWTPLLDGTERLGVLRLDFPQQDEPGQDLLGQDLLSGCQDVAALLAEMVMTRSLYGDVVEPTHRRSPMTLPAELAWRVLPPLTFVLPRVSVAGALAPAAEVGGDSFDYALNGDILHVVILDTMGHGLQATLLATVAVGTLRNARRAGLGLAATVHAVDSALAGQSEAGTFVTGIVGALDLVGGWWRWSTCGRAPGAAVRSGRVVKQLDAVTDRRWA